jgi:hypothetical protein
MEEYLHASYKRSEVLTAVNMMIMVSDCDVIQFCTLGTYRHIGVKRGLSLSYKNMYRVQTYERKVLSNTRGSTMEESELEHYITNSLMYRVTQ